ncbi:MAG: nicotinamide riboside transporter PnuC [Ekhidna sp.]
MSIWQDFIDQLLQTSAIEFIAVISGIASVWFSKQEKILVYPFGIISVTLYIFITYQSKLYADSGINAYYLVMSIFGWWNWKNTKDLGRNQIPITTSTKTGNIVNLATFLFAAGFIYIMLIKFTDSDVPLMDSITTGLAITAMYLMALKKIEHWIFWIACNLISIPLYIYKELPFTSFQFIVFTYIAIMGWMSWKTKVKLENA